MTALHTLSFVLLLLLFHKCNQSKFGTQKKTKNNLEVSVLTIFGENFVDLSSKITNGNNDKTTDAGNNTMSQDLNDEHESKFI